VYLIWGMIRASPTASPRQIGSKFANFSPIVHSNSLAKCLTKIVSPLQDFSLAAHGKPARLANRPVPTPISSPPHVPISALCYCSCSCSPVLPAIYLLRPGRQNRRASSPSKIHHQITLPITSLLEMLLTKKRHTPSI
jgi:hypothetical protein